jgi:hypothetical protein
MLNSLERLFNPSLLDIIFPIFAFITVILLPSFFAAWVIFRVVTGRFLNKKLE